MTRGFEAYDLTEHAALVTGSGSGIGAEIAALLTARGADVMVADIDADAAARIADQLGARHGRLDVTDHEGVHRFVAAHGPFDILVNNAAVCSDEDFLTIAPETFDRDVRVSLHGAYHCTQAVLPTMIARNGGTIVNIASVNGLAYYGNEAYSAAKAGLISLTRSIAVKYGGAGVRCNAVAPGTVLTGLWEERLAVNPELVDQVETFYPLGRPGTRREIAESVAFLASPASSWITGTCLTIDGGLTAGNTHLRDAIVIAAQTLDH